MSSATHGADGPRYPHAFSLAPRLKEGNGGVELVLRARIWCEARLVSDAWFCDDHGVFWFSSIDDKILFALTWS